MRLKEIAQLKDKTFFTVQDVARLFGVTLGSARVQCSRYAKQGIFLRLKNNFYVLGETWQSGNHDYFLRISNYLQVPSYVSMMSALFYHGITTQVPRAFYESVCARRSIRYEVKGVSLNYYKFKKEQYFGFTKKDNLFIALPEKAFVDAVYLESFGKYKLDYEAIDFSKFDKSALKDISRAFPDKTRKRVKKICGI